MNCTTDPIHCCRFLMSKLSAASALCRFFSSILVYILSPIGFILDEDIFLYLYENCFALLLFALLRTKSSRGSIHSQPLARLNEMTAMFYKYTAMFYQVYNGWIVNQLESVQSKQHTHPANKLIITNKKSLRYRYNVSNMNNVKYFSK